MKSKNFVVAKNHTLSTVSLSAPLALSHWVRLLSIITVHGMSPPPPEAEGGPWAAPRVDSGGPGIREYFKPYLFFTSFKSLDNFLVK